MEINTTETENPGQKEMSAVDILEQAALAEERENTQSESSEQQQSNIRDAQNNENTTNNDLDWSLVPSEFQEVYKQSQEITQKLENDVRASQGRLRKAQEAAKNAISDSSINFDDVDNEHLTEVREEFPEVYGAMKASNDFQNKRIEQAMAPAQAFVDSMGEQQEQLDNQIFEDSLSRIAEKHPDYLEVNASPEFATWLNDQNAETRHSQASDNPEVLIGLFDKYQAFNAQQSNEAQSDLLESHAELPRHGPGRAAENSDNQTNLFAQVAAERAQRRKNKG